MNDRELLELAAKAAGIDGDVETYTWNAAKWGRPESESKTSMFIRTGPTEAWNPLTDDGDALRLAILLDLLSDDARCSDYCKARCDSDPYAATRRAIVRAAAEIGKLK